MVDELETEPISYEEGVARIRAIADGLDAVGQQVASGQPMVDANLVRRITKNYAVEIYHVTMQMEEPDET